MSEMIHERNASEKVERYDLFSSLLAANNEDEDGVRLTESELIGLSLVVVYPIVLISLVRRHPRKYFHLSSCWT